jgi:hypothetical protein
MVYNITEFQHESLLEVPIIDFKQSCVYQRIKPAFYSSMPLQRELSPQQFLYSFITCRQFLFFALKDTEHIHYSVLSNDTRYSRIPPELNGMHFFTLSRSYDGCTGITVKSTSIITGINVYFSQSTKTIRGCCFDIVPDQLTTHISFLPPGCNAFTWDTQGLFYNYFSGIPTVLLWDCDIFIKVSTAEENATVEVIPDTVWLSSDIRASFAAHKLQHQHTLFTVGPQQYLCVQGSVVEKNANNVHPLLEWMNSECQSCLYKDTLRVIAEYMY